MICYWVWHYFGNLLVVESDHFVVGSETFTCLLARQWLALVRLVSLYLSVELVLHGRVIPLIEGNSLVLLDRPCLNDSLLHLSVLAR